MEASGWLLAWVAVQIGVREPHRLLCAYYPYPSLLVKVRGAFASLLDAELFELSGLSALCAAVPCGVPPSRESTRRMDAWMCPCEVHSF